MWMWRTTPFGGGAGGQSGRHGLRPTTHAVFGAMADKDLAPILARINPLIDRWYFTDLPAARRQRCHAAGALGGPKYPQSHGLRLAGPHGSTAGGHVCGRPH